MSEDLEAKKVYYCLKPSLPLKLCLFLAVFLCLYIVLSLWVSYIVALLLAVLCSNIAVGVDSTIGDYLARQAELRKTQPNIWFVLDKEAEYSRYGPFRAKKRADGLGKNNDSD